MMELPECPHCGHKINYLQSWALKAEGEYWCAKCGDFSNVKLKRPVYTLGYGVIAMGVITFLIYLIFIKSIHIWVLLLLLFPYLLFQSLCPFYVSLKAPQRKQPPQNHRTQPGTGAGYPSVRTASPPPRTSHGVPRK